MPRTSRSRKTSHPHISQIRKTSLPRTTRSSLFPLIIIHVRRYGESSEGPYHPWGRACDRVCVSDCLGRRGAPSLADMQEDRKTWGQGGQPDTLSGAGRTQAAPDLASLAPTAHPAYPVCLPCPVSRHTHVYHIVNASVTRAPLKTAFCQAILLFPDLSKRYTLIHNDLHAN